MMHLTPHDIDRWLDGALPRRRQRHLHECAACAQEARAHRLIAQALEALPHYAPRPGFADRVMRRIHLPAPVPLAAAPQRRPFAPKVWAAAAVFAALSLASMAAVTLLALSQPGAVTSAAGWLAGQAALLADGALAAAREWLGALPASELVDTALAHPSQALAVLAAFMATYTAAMYRLWTLMRLPGRGYARSA